MTPFIFVVASLAVWRLSRGIVKEDGPLMVFARLRARLARTQKRSGGLFDMVSCTLCLSMWIGFLSSLWLVDGVFSWFMYGLAFSGVTTILEHLTQRRQ